MSVPVRGRKPYFAFSTAILVINSVVGGATVGCALGIVFEAPLWVATSVGGVAAIVSVFTWIRYAARLLDATAAVDESLFPSAGAAAVSTQHTGTWRRGS